MMVVVVIGILAATLGPQYEKYLIQSKSMEGPISLANIYSAEQQMFSVTGTYVACVFALAIEPPNQGYFVTGFNPTDNYGKRKTWVPNCDASPDGNVTPFQSVTCTETFLTGEKRCTRNSDPVHSDYVLIPKTLLIRGMSSPANDQGFRSPMPEIQCHSYLLSSSGWSGSQGSQDGSQVYAGFGGTALEGIGKWRQDTQFRACGTAAFTKRTSSNPGDPGYAATEYTIDQDKSVMQVNTGW